MIIVRALLLVTGLVLAAGSLAPADMAKLTHGNADALLRLKAKAG